MKIVLIIIGNIRTRIFVSSTCVTVHVLHGPLLSESGESVVLIIAARSKNLQHLSRLVLVLLIVRVYTGADLVIGRGTRVPLKKKIYIVSSF